MKQQIILERADLDGLTQGEALEWTFANGQHLVITAEGARRRGPYNKNGKSGKNGDHPAAEGTALTLDEVRTALKQSMKAKDGRHIYPKDLKKNAVATFKASGLTARDFCEKVGVHESQLRDWRQPGRR